MADLSFTQGAAPVTMVNDVSGNQQIVNTDGSTNSKITDGTNFQPTGDVAARAIFGKVTDGTNTAMVDTDGSLFVKPVPIGTQGNAWNAATVSSGNNSAVIDCQYVRTVSIFGNTSNNLNPLRIQASQDNSNWYTITTLSLTTGNWGTTIDWGARYLRLQSGQGSNFTVTATVAGK